MRAFNMRLSDDQRERLEAHRARLGLRSHADVVRYWIDQGVSGAASPSSAPRPTVSPLRLPQAAPGARLKKGPKS